MGREASCACIWAGKRGTVKALLESGELILRGEIKEKLPRSSIGSVRVNGDALEISVGRKKLVLELGATAAEQWAKAIARAPPTLARKLGVNAENKCFVVGKLDDEALAEAVGEHRARSSRQAAMLLAVIRTEKALRDAEAQARAAALPLWCVYAKGKAAAIGDGAVRSFLRAHGFMDNKTCAVSETLTATRYALKARQV